MVTRKPQRILTALYLMTFAAVFLVCCTRLGFPYSGDKESGLALHRAFIVHTERESYSKVIISFPLK